WITGSMSPQKIRDAILNPNGEFQHQIVEYLESVHTGDFATGSKTQVQEMMEEQEMSESYMNPLHTLPKAPPKNNCSCNPSNCEQCGELHEWKQYFAEQVDDIVLRTHVHKYYLWCLDNKWGTCKARFPREVFATTHVDIDTRALRLKKLELWENTYNPVMTYLLRCNSDVTSLLSGTAIKAVVAYVTNYIPKLSLNTYVIFDVIRTIFAR
ncbi:hypothetical protein K435DRAFT_559483, partial [Dendrothele bispora CBS 962.96]